MKNKLVAIYKNRIKPNDSEIQIYLDILDYNKISYVLVDSGDLYFWEKIRNADLFIFKWGHDHHSQQIAHTILPIIESTLGIPCFPNLATCWHYDDKIKQYFLLDQSGFPVIPSYVFWDKTTALSWINKHHNFPLVFKLRNGAGSFSVFLVRNQAQATRFIRRLFGRGIKQSAIPVQHLARTFNYDFRKIIRYYTVALRNHYINKEKNVYWLRHKNYIYFQDFMPNNGWDTRVTTAGLRAHAFRRFNRRNDFRASGSNQWDISPEHIDLRMIRIALDVSRYFGFQAMAYDFVYDQNHEPKIGEMSYLYGGAGFPDFMNGYWDENLTWYSGRYWPQYFELKDILGLRELMMPDDLMTDTAYKKAKIH